MNRRVFARPGDVSPTSRRGEHMDSLAESRKITIRFNLSHPIEKNPQRKQYAFLRVREVLPTQDTLPGQSGRRHGLDTLVHSDSAVNVLLGPGQGALLQATYADFDDQFERVDLRFNGQRKMIYDGLGPARYHLVYWIRDSVGANSQVFYRRSDTVSSPFGSIRWEPTEHSLGNELYETSSYGVGDSLRVNNAFPSITFRKLGSNKVVCSVIWTCHPRNANSGPSDREIVRRNIMTNATTGELDFGPLEVVAMHAV